jgi:hypothetical protein
MVIPSRFAGVVDGDGYDIQTRKSDSATDIEQHSCYQEV